MQFTHTLPKQTITPSSHTNTITETKEKEIETTFEGCEKRLTLWFNGTGDLRTITKLKWIKILKYARCEILNTVSNMHCIAHLLSESSLFIFTNKLMIKTCGTTLLLMILPIIINECNQINLIISNVFYSRSNFMYPSDQPIIHSSFNNEIEYLNKYFNGYGIILGSLNNARWHCYTNNKLDYGHKNEITIEIVLFDLNEKCMQYYFQNNGYNKKELDKRIINGCCIHVNSMIDSYLFEPCGYSLNGVLNDNYWTIHITPEKNGSFVSFETNYNYNNYRFVIEKVVGLFKPKRFSFAINCYNNNGLFDVFNRNNNWKLNGFNVSNNAMHTFSKYHKIMWYNYCLNDYKCENVMNRLDVRCNDTFSFWKFIQNNIVYLNDRYSKSTSQLLSFRIYGKNEKDNNE